MPIMHDPRGRNHLFEDDSGIIHACEYAQMGRDTLFAWTKCERDVPGNGSFMSHESATCKKCLGEKP